MGGGAGDADATALLLVMGAQASGVGWPDELVDALAAHHRVVRYDHRDTGRSTWSYETRPYAITDLADDALAVLDGLGVERAHVVGMSLGGMLAQLLIADHPERLRTATLIGTCALSTTPYTAPDGTVTPVGSCRRSTRASWTCGPTAPWTSPRRTRWPGGSSTGGC